MDNLPTALFYVIQLYLTPYEYRQFLSSSNSDSFKEIRYLTLYYGLTFQYSEEFCVSSAFRQRVLCKMKDKSRQLGLKLYRLLPRLHNSFHRNVDSLQVNDTHRHKDFSNFQGISVLSLIENDVITNCNGLVYGLTSLSVVRFSQLRDLSQLLCISSLSTVDLCYCDSLSDVSGLRNVKNLKMMITGKKVLTGLSSLTHLTTLFLEYYQIDGEELKNLTKLVTLTLSRCDSLTDSSLKELVSLRKVTLSSCNGITDISMLGRCSWIAVRNCPIETLTGLGNVKSIIIEDCFKLKSFHGLGKNNRYLSMYMQDMVNIAPLKSIHTVKIRYGEPVSMEQLSNVQRLHLESVTIKDLSVSNTLQLLLLVECEGLIKLPKSLSSVPVIHLIRLYHLKDISNLGNNQQVIVADCNRIADVSSLRNINDVRIHNCRAVKNYSSLVNVKRLEIWNPLEVQTVNEQVKRLSEEREIILKKTSYDYEIMFPDGFDDPAED
jgi:hypothetical protein